MRSVDLHQTIREAIAYHEVFRKLGFLPSDIFVSVAEVFGKRGFQMVLKTQGKQFVVNVGFMEDSREEVLKQWHDAVIAIRDRTFLQEDLNQLYVESLAYKYRMEMATAIVAKGIRLLKGAN